MAATLIQRFSCNACGATYGSTCPDGMPYYHACALVPDVAAGAAPTGAQPDQRPYVPRPGHRDENMVFELSPEDEDRPRTRSVRIASPGAGVTKIA
jgi:hypothetical protein